jgi:hypothetical protein
MPRVTDFRVVLSLGVSALGGTLGLHAYPFPADQAVLALVHLTRPALCARLHRAHVLGMSVGTNPMTMAKGDLRSRRWT